MKFRIVFTLLAALLMLTACNDDNNSSSTPSLQGTFQTFVTYMGSGDDGSSFTVTQPGTTVLTTFTSVKKFPTEGETALTPGERVVIYYKNSADKRYASGPIDLRGVSKIYCGAVSSKPQPEISPMVVDMIDVQSLELSGTYINVVAQAATSTPPLFDIWFDEATVDTDTPVGYVVFRTDTQNTQRVIMGSFNAADIIAKPTCRTLLIHYNTDAGAKTASFPTGHQTIQPME